MKPRCWTSDSRCKFASQQRLEGLEGPSTSHCALAQLLLGRASGEQLESSFWPTVQRWWAEPRERGGGAPAVGRGPACLHPSEAGMGGTGRGASAFCLLAEPMWDYLSPGLRWSVGTLALSAEGTGVREGPALPNDSPSQSRMADPSQGGQMQHKDHMGGTYAKELFLVCGILLFLICKKFKFNWASYIIL